MPEKQKSSVEKFTLIRKLSFDANQIENAAPLAKLVNLRTLELSSNSIRDLTPLLDMLSLKNAETEYFFLSARYNPLLACSPKDNDDLLAGKRCPEGAAQSWYWRTQTTLGNFVIDLFTW